MSRMVPRTFGSAFARGMSPAEMREAARYFWSSVSAFIPKSRCPDFEARITGSDARPQRGR
jgi:hypothetical protein